VLHAHLAAFALVVSALVMSSCGGSSKSGSQTAGAIVAAPGSITSSATLSLATVVVKPVAGKPLTHAEWITKGEAICARLNAQLAATPAKSVTEFARALPQAAAYEQSELAQLVKLTPPPSRASDWQQFLTGTREWADDSAKMGASARAGQFNANMPLFQATQKAHEKLAAIAKRDGFKECALL
jgi:hypothetical protein